MKVYIVTEGEYSDYHIVGVFATREAAEKYCAVHGNYSVYGDPINIEDTRSLYTDRHFPD